MIKIKSGRIDTFPDALATFLLLPLYIALNGIVAFRTLLKGVKKR